MKKQVNSEAYTMARQLLREYTGNGSIFNRILYGFWNRHHVNVVEKILQDSSVKTIQQLMFRLEGIPLVNKNGSLARIIKQIKEVAPSSALEADSSTTIADDSCYIQAIAAFLNYFNYLNSQGKRQNSYFFTFFNNKALTTDLETIATNLPDKIKEITQNNHFNNQNKFQEFIKLINNNLDNVWSARRERAPILAHRISPQELELRMSLRGEYSFSNYRTPYSGGQFEKNLIVGLKKAIAILGSSPFSAQIDSIIQRIEHYNPRPEECSSYTMSNYNKW